MMKLTVEEQGKDKIAVQAAGEDHTILNALRENAVLAGAKQATVLAEHPYLNQPKIVVRATAPKKTLSDAAQSLADDAKAFQREFSRAAGK